MIGNDVIDLHLAQKESNWKRKGFLDKIYTKKEQNLINSSSHPELLVWILWSMKESSYKANNRITSVREYAPTKINCSIDRVVKNIYYGTSTYNNIEFQLRTFIFKEYIHTIALYNSNDFFAIKKIIIKNYPSNYMAFLENEKFLNTSEKILKNEMGVPNLYNEITRELNPISISHHGSFLCIITFKDRKK